MSHFNGSIVKFLLIQNEMISLKKDNERLQKEISAHQSDASSPLNSARCHRSPVPPAEEMSSMMGMWLHTNFDSLN